MKAATCERAPLPENMVGHQLLAKLGGASFLVRVLEHDAQTIRISFPGTDNPLEDTWLRLEWHDDEGVTAFRARVIEGSRRDRPGLLLEYPTTVKRRLHRDAFRVPTDLVAQVHHRGHAEHRYSAEVVNLSSGGALIQLDAPIPENATVTMNLNMPRLPRCQLTGEVVHIRTRRTTPLAVKGLYGIRFIDAAKHTRESLSHYVGERLRHLSCVD